MLVRKVVAAGLLALGAAGLAFAASESTTPGADTGEHHMHHRHGPMGPSVERAAMHNIMAELLSAKTGKPVAEITALFENNDPHEAIEQLGLKPEDLRPLFKQAHETLIQKAQAAGLITAAQATKLRAEPLPEHMGHRPPEEDEKQ